MYTKKRRIFHNLQGRSYKLDQPAAQAPLN